MDKQYILNFISTNGLEDVFTEENIFYSLYNCNLYAYFRVSTSSQEFDREILELYKWSKKKGITIFIDNIYCDVTTAKRLNRENYNQLRAIVKENDYILVSNLNRLGRGDPYEGYENVKKEWYYYKSQDVKLLIAEDELSEYISAPLPFEDNDTTINRMYLQDMIFTNILYKDCLKLIEVSNTTKSGLEKARLKGKKLGRPRKSDLNGFIETLEYMVKNNVGQNKACIAKRYPSMTFKKDLKSYYVKYRTTDYAEILEKLKKETKC